ncbi:MAG: hypothetical protein ACI9MB_004284, partial [Verrucomicrobiales bacterium]
ATKTAGILSSSSPHEVFGGAHNLIGWERDDAGAWQME